LRLQIEQVPLTTLDLYAADECFLTGTGAELIPVASIGNHNLPEDKPMFNKLSEAFQEEVRTIQVEHSNSI
jgi:branched-chain amino acid aminotransferase